MTVKVWLVDTGELILTLDGHRESVNSVTFNNASLIASGSNDKTVKIWDLNTGKCIQTLIEHKSYDKYGLLATGSTDKTVKVWK